MKIRFSFLLGIILILLNLSCGAVTVNEDEPMFSWRMKVPLTPVMEKEIQEELADSRDPECFLWLRKLNVERYSAADLRNSINLLNTLNVLLKDDLVFFFNRFPHKINKSLSLFRMLKNFQQRDSSFMVSQLLRIPDPLPDGQTCLSLISSLRQVGLEGRPSMPNYTRGLDRLPVHLNQPAMNVFMDQTLMLKKKIPNLEDEKWLQWVRFMLSLSDKQRSAFSKGVHLLLPDEANAAEAHNVLVALNELVTETYDPKAKIAQVQQKLISKGISPTDYGKIILQIFDVIYGVS